MEKLSIVILNYNGKEILKQTLESLVKSISSSGPKIIVVDNGSTDGSKEYLKRFAEKSAKIDSEVRVNLSLIENQSNLGFTGGNNVGIRQALKDGADYVMLLNNDVIVKNAFWKPLVGFLEENQKVGIVGPKIYFAPGCEFHQDRYSKKDRGKVIWCAGGMIDWGNVYTPHQGVNEVDSGQYGDARETDFVSGCCLLAKRKVWEEVGLLDERYFLYFEDVDFCLQAKKKGWETYFVPESKIWHLNAGSSGCGGELQDYFITRNRLLFGMRWAPLRTKLALIRESFRILMRSRRWQKLGVRDFYLRKFVKGSWQ